MKKFFDAQGIMIGMALFIGIFLNQKNCIPDPTCDPDPLYGGCSSGCEFGTVTQYLSKSFGVWMLLNIGGFLGKENLKKKDNLKDFLNMKDLKQTTYSITDEFRAEDKESDMRVRELLKKLDSKEDK